MLKETFKSSLANSHSASVKLLAIHYLSLMHCTSFLTREIRLSAVIVMMMYCCHRNKSILVSLPIKFLNSQLLEASERSFSKLINGRESWVFFDSVTLEVSRGKLPLLPSQSRCILPGQPGLRDLSHVSILILSNYFLS